MKYIIQLFFFLLISCSYPELIRDELVYSNDFEDSNLNKIDGGNISNYNGSLVLGNYNDDGFNLHLEDIGSHDYVQISFDLYMSPNACLAITTGSFQ